MLAGLDVLICDLQDVGARFYTYFSTVASCLEVAADCGLPVVVLDRPNPLGGLSVEGPTLQNSCRSFVGYAPLPVRHGMTMGELAKWFVHGSNLKVSLEVVPAQNWERSMEWAATGLPWRQPSPNLPTSEAAAWYPGTCLLEFSDLCVGRGTPWPFQLVAAPWLDSEALGAALEPVTATMGFEISACSVVPAHAVHAGLQCRGVRFSSAGGAPGEPVKWGLHLLDALIATQPSFTEEKLRAALPLVGSEEIVELLWQRQLPDALQRCQRDAARFNEERQKFLLY